MIVVAVERDCRIDAHRWDPRGHLTRIGRHVELRDRTRGAATVTDVLPELFATDSEWRDDADAGDDHAPAIASTDRTSGTTSGGHARHYNRAPWTYPPTRCTGGGGRLPGRAR